MPFRCPVCGAISHNPTDEREGYCGRCHDFTGHVAPVERNDFEIANGVTYCRRCGSVIAKDMDPRFVPRRPCRTVWIELRG